MPTTNVHPIEMSSAAGTTVSPLANPRSRAADARAEFAPSPAASRHDSPRWSRPWALYSESGFSLIEVLVALVMSLIVLVATFGILNSTQQVQARDTEWALTVEQARAGLARIAREIRQAYSVKAVTSNSIDFEGTFGGVKKEIYYECDVSQPGTSFRECVRLSATPPASLPSLSTGTPIVKDLLNGTNAEPMFSYAPDTISPSYVSLRAILPASGTYKPAERAYKHHVVLYGGAYIRAMNLGG